MLSRTYKAIIAVGCGVVPSNLAPANINQEVVYQEKVCHTIRHKEGKRVKNYIHNNGDVVANKESDRTDTDDECEC